MFFINLLLLLRVFYHENLSKNKILSFHSMLDAFRQFLLNANRKKIRHNGHGLTSRELPSAAEKISQGTFTFSCI